MLQSCIVYTSYHFHQHKLCNYINLLSQGQSELRQSAVRIPSNKEHEEEERRGETLNYVELGWLHGSCNYDSSMLPLNEEVLISQRFIINFIVFDSDCTV